MKDIPLTRLKDLRADPNNARRHGPRNVRTIVSALEEVGAARSIVIDERVVDVDGKTIVAVRRRGLTKDQKAKLALYDNRASELAEGWEGEVLSRLQNDGVDLSRLWNEKELAELVGSEEGRPDEIPEMALQPFESYDYLFVVFKNSQDWQGACDELAIGRVAVVIGGARKIGLGRVLDGAVLLARLRKQ